MRVCGSSVHQVGSPLLNVMTVTDMYTPDQIDSVEQCDGVAAGHCRLRLLTMAWRACFRVRGV